MRYVVTQDLYHRPDCTGDLMQMIGDKAQRRSESADTLEQNGYDPCPHCLPEQSE